MDFYAVDEIADEVKERQPMRWRKRWNLPLIATATFVVIFSLGLTVGWNVMFQRNDGKYFTPRENATDRLTEKKIPNGKSLFLAMPTPGIDIQSQ